MEYRGPAGAPKEACATGPVIGPGEYGNGLGGTTLIVEAGLGPGGL